MQYEVIDSLEGGVVDKEKQVKNGTQKEKSHFVFEEQKYKNTTEKREEIKSTKIIILQYMYVSKHHAINLKIIQCYMSIICQ